jgi:hypothetical protein
LFLLKQLALVVDRLQTTKVVVVERMPLQLLSLGFPPVALRTTVWLLVAQPLEQVTQTILGSTLTQTPTQPLSAPLEPLREQH